MNNFSLIKWFEKVCYCIFDLPANKTLLDLDVNSLIADLNTFTSDYSELLGQLRDVNISIHTSNKGLVSFITDFNSTFELIKYNVEDTNTLIYDLQNKLNLMKIDFNYAQTMLNDSLIKQEQIKTI